MAEGGKMPADPVDEILKRVESETSWNHGHMPNGSQLVQRSISPL
jgi:hypothetical protein